MTADLEQITAALLPADFNSSDDENQSFDSRSDNKGPEPEVVVVGKIEGEVYAFVGLERVGGVMVYNVTDPSHVRFVQYVNTRDFSILANEDDGNQENLVYTDASPEGLFFVPAEDSPSGKALLIVAHEVSGSVVIFEIIGD